MLGTILSPKNTIKKNAHLGREGGFEPPESGSALGNEHMAGEYCCQRTLPWPASVELQLYRRSPVVFWVRDHNSDRIPEMKLISGKYDP
jgi:hypothetical protein